jgi:hypothetical protein
MSFTAKLNGHLPPIFKQWNVAMKEKQKKKEFQFLFHVLKESFPHSENNVKRLRER